MKRSTRVASLALSVALGACAPGCIPRQAPAQFPAATSDDSRLPVPERVRRVTAEQLNLDPAAVTLASRFTEDLRADSLDLVELSMAFEEAFGITIPDEEAERVLTVGQAADLVTAKLKQRDKGNTGPE